jgi:hypothetical protein
MTSNRKIEANRRNSRKSCGPRGAAGQSFACRNALRHGLAAIVHRQPVLCAEIEQFARALCGNETDPVIFAQAKTIAVNEMMLRAIRAEQIVAVERLRQNEKYGRDEHQALEAAVSDLTRLGRYERRAWSRQKRAFRDFISIIAESRKICSAQVMENGTL